MKKNNILIIFGFFVLLFGAAQPTYAGIDSVQTFGLVLGPGQIKIIRPVAQLNAAASKFEGLLSATIATARAEASGSAKLDFNGLEKQLFTAANDLSASLNEFNTVLSEIYPDLTEEEQLAIDNAYSSLEVYFVDLVAKANSVFDKELFWIEYGEPLNKTSNSTTQGRFITIIDDLN